VFFHKVKWGDKASEVWISEDQNGMWLVCAKRRWWKITKTDCTTYP